MRFLSRDLTVIASILLILMSMGCDAPAGSAGSAGGAAAPGSVAPLEQTLAELPAGELESVNAEPTLSGGSVDSFGVPGAGNEVDDPFAAIGSTFSGLGFQSYSSSCDPFEDAYGTCL